jgi:hypothetical protein
MYIGNSLLGQASKFADRFVGPLTVTRPHGGSHYALLGKDGREYKARKEELKRYVSEEAESRTSIRELHEALAEPENARPAFTDLPHMQPDVRQSGFSGSNRSVRIQWIRRIWQDCEVHRNWTSRHAPKRGPTCAPHSAPISFSPNTQNSYHFILVEVSIV